MDEVRIVLTGEQYADGFNAVVDAVARERRYIGFVEGPSLERTREFVRSINVFMALLGENAPHRKR